MSELEPRIWVLIFNALITPWKLLLPHTGRMPHRAGGVRALEESHGVLSHPGALRLECSRMDLDCLPVKDRGCLESASPQRQSPMWLWAERNSGLFPEDRSFRVDGADPVPSKDFVTQTSLTPWEAATGPTIILATLFNHFFGCQALC